MPEFCRVEREGRLLVVTLDRPDVLNALHPPANFELEKVGRPSLTNNVIDTVMVARERHPGARVSLDALCKHYGIDNSKRVKHGALLAVPLAVLRAVRPAVPTAVAAPGP